MKKSPVQRNVSSHSEMRHRHGIRKPASGNVEALQHKDPQGRKYPCLPDFQLDGKDIWQYIKRENIEIVPLYFAKERPVIYRDGNIIMVDDDRLKLREGEKIEIRKYVSVHLAAIR